MPNIDRVKHMAEMVPTDALPYLYSSFASFGAEDKARTVLAEIDRRDDEAMAAWYAERGLTMPPPYFGD